MDDKKLLQTLVEESLISEELAQQITVESARSEKSAEDILYARHLLDEVSIAKAKSKILGLPYEKVKADAITDELLKLIPAETAGAEHMVPLAVKAKLLVA